VYRLHNVCRACGLGKPEIPTLKESCAAGPSSAPTSLIPVFDLGVQPLANDFVGPTEDHAGYAPLKVLFCPRCSLAQLSVVVEPQLLYRHYAYVTSPSQMMREHFDALASTLLEEQNRSGPIVEIGSNDGLLLQHFSGRGFGNVCGIEPADNLASIATARGVLTINEFFCQKSATMARTAVGEPDFILARHIFCHVDDWRAFFVAMDALAGKDTVIAIEVPYALDQLQAVSWDQCYHEHLSYLSLKAVKALLADTPFHLHRIVRYPIHGGAILMLIRRNDCLMQPHPSVVRMLEKENITADTWRQFGITASNRIGELSAMVRNLVSEGKTVVGYGASAKSTVWISACGFTRRQIRWICDATPQKQYKTSPGTDIPIVDEGALTRELPDYAILFAWNYASEVVHKEKIFWEKGGRWIVPVPQPRVISMDTQLVEA
jgi:hypothetical protein